MASGGWDVKSGPSFLDSIEGGQKKKTTHSADEGGKIGRQVKDYADGTSIHGIKYTVEPGRPMVER